MKRIMHLFFCTTCVMGLSGKINNQVYGPGDNIGITTNFQSQGDEESDDKDVKTNVQQGFREFIDLGWLESFYSTVYSKKTVGVVFLSLTGEELVQNAGWSSVDKIVKLSTSFEGTNQYPVIPNINYFKDTHKRQVDGHNEQVIYIPQGTVYQEVAFSPAKIVIALLVAGVGIGTAYYCGTIDYKCSSK